MKTGTACQAGFIIPRLKGTKQWGNYKEKAGKASKLQTKRYHTRFGRLTITEIAEKLGVNKRRLDYLHGTKYKQTLSYNEILEKYLNEN